MKQQHDKRQILLPRGLLPLHNHLPRSSFNPKILDHHFNIPIILSTQRRIRSVMPRKKYPLVPNPIKVEHFRCSQCVHTLIRLGTTGRVLRGTKLRIYRCVNDMVGIIEVLGLLPIRVLNQAFQHTSHMVRTAA